MEPILEYGLRDNTLISVHSLTEEEKGEKCNCVCPSCGGKLIAKLGKVKKKLGFVLP